MAGNEVYELAVRDLDGNREVRLSSDRRQQYPAEAWARDHAALGSKVRRRRIIVLEPWADLPIAGHRAGPPAAEGSY